METNIDCMKHRKSSHLAKVDVEAIIAEKGICELTIDLAYYETGVMVNGRATDGYFLRFKEPIKEMIANSGNRQKIADILKIEKKITMVEARNIGNWAGLKISLLADDNVKMKGEKVGGIVVDKNYRPTKVEKPTLVINSEAFDKAKLAVEAGTFDLAKLKTYYTITEEVQIALGL